MRDIQAEIKENLKEIEEHFSVRILIAVESGSRAWGFASPDSDYDVRFIYVQKFEEYLRIDRTKDVIEWKLDEVLDINGWDLKKALAAYAKGNPNLMEWAGSPIIYKQAEEWAKIRETIGKYFSEKTALCHYYGTANAAWQGYLTGEMVRYKKYFYALRPLLCCRWVERYHTMPPVEFGRLLQIFEDDEFPDGLREAIDRLLVLKAATVEKDLNPQIPEIRTFIETECARQKELSDQAADDHNKDLSELNRLFRELVLAERDA